MFEKSLRYPFEGEALRRFLVVTLLYVGSILILPLFIITGYTVRAGRNVARGEEHPPEFKKWVELLVLGLKTGAVALAYLLVPLIAVGGGAVMIGVTEGPIRVLSLVFVAIGGVGYILLLYVLPVAMLAVDMEERLGAGFDLSVLKPVLMSSDYLVAFGAMFGLSIVSGVVTNVLAFTIVGLLLVPAVAFYFSLVGYYLFGDAYGKVHSTEDGPRTQEPVPSSWDA
jgi:hypothetical protein